MTDPNLTSPKSASASAPSDAQTEAKRRAIEQARKLAAARKAKQAQSAMPDTTTEAATVAPATEAPLDPQAEAKRRAIEQARKLAAARKAKQAQSAMADTSAAAASVAPAPEAPLDPQAEAKRRAIEQARKLAAARKDKQAQSAMPDTTTEAATVAPAPEAPLDPQAEAKRRAIEQARKLAAAHKAKQAQSAAADNATEAEASVQISATVASDEKLRAIEQARKLTAARKAKQALSEVSSADAQAAPTAAQEPAPAASGLKAKLQSLVGSKSVEGVLLESKPKQSSLFEIFLKGIWKDNPGLCQLLGMCPLLAVTTSAANALGLGIATILVLIMSSSAIALIRRFIVPEVRIPIYVIIIAALVTMVRFEVEANFPELYQQLGIYLSLIATNCIIMGRAEAFAGHNNVLRSCVDAIASGIGFTLVLFTLGSIREIIGNGTWLVGASDLLGSWAAGLEMHLYGSDYTLLIAILPPGGFFVLAFLIAAKNALDARVKRKKERTGRIDVMHI